MDLDHSFFPGFPSGGVEGGGLQGRSDGSGESSLMNRDPNLLLWVIRGLGVHFFLIFFFTSGCFSTDPKVVAEACSSRVFSFCPQITYVFISSSLTVYGMESDPPVFLLDPVSEANLNKG